MGPLNLYEWTGSGWSRRTLLEHLDPGHTLQVADLDGDGRQDIFTGEMHTPGAGEACRTLILFGEGEGRFRTEILSTGIGSHESKVGDLDGDGRLDILQKDF